MAVTVTVAKDQMPAVTFLDPFFWVTWKGRLLCGFTTESQAKTAAKALVAPEMIFRFFASGFPDPSANTGQELQLADP